MQSAFTTIIDIVLLLKQQKHSMHIMQSSEEEKMSKVCDKLKYKQTILSSQIDAF